MVKVDISALEGEDKQELASFIESKLQVKSEKDGDVVSFEDKSERTHVTVPEVRTYLKRFMHKRSLRKKFRVLSEEGALKFVKRPETGNEEEEEEEAEKNK